MRKRAIAALGALAALPVLASPAAAQSGLTTNLPLVVIEAPGGIADEPKRTATMRVIDRRHGPNVPSLQGNAYSGRIGIELRGSSSLRFPKKSYALETRKRSGKARNVSLLGLPKDDDWVLLANHNDRSLIRNALVYATARWLGRYASRTRHVEVVVNGSYQGVYLLAERLKLMKRRIAIDDGGVSGGYLLEMKSPEKMHSGDRSFRTGKGRPVVYADPDRKDLSRREAGWIARYVRSFERALYRPGFRHPERGYRRYLDVGAAVDFLLLNELFKNHDTFRHSAYMHKGAGGKLVLGPLWDFDIAMGNYQLAKSVGTSGWVLDDYLWARRLYRDPALRRQMAARWRTTREQGLLRHLMRSIDADAQLLGSAQARNFSRWPILGQRVFENPVDPRSGRLPQSHGQEVDYLKWWLRNRVQWMDANISRLRA